MGFCHRTGSDLFLFLVEYVLNMEAKHTRLYICPNQTYKLAIYTGFIRLPEFGRAHWNRNGLQVPDVVHVTVMSPPSPT